MENMSTTPEVVLFQKAAALIAQADSLIVAAGAGMGVDSGLPDFRGNDGFWKAYPALHGAGMDFRDIATPSIFYSQPSLAWGFYGHRLDLYRRTLPHAGFASLHRWGGQMQHGYRVYTSNVDGQFQKAGFDQNRIYECHGSIHHLQCLKPCSESIWDAGDFIPDVAADICRLRNPAPKCRHCGGLARPNILMFNDTGWCDSRALMQSEQQNVWLTSVAKPVVIELGAGIAIPSVRNFSERIVKSYGGRLVRINPQEPGVTTALDVGLRMGATEALRGIADALGTHWA